jgi:hypothetical protein
VAAVQGAPWRAIRLARAAAALRTQVNQPLAAREWAKLEELLVPARRAISAEEQAAVWAEG